VEDAEETTTSGGEADAMAPDVVVEDAVSPDAVDGVDEDAKESSASVGEADDMSPDAVVDA